MSYNQKEQKKVKNPKPLSDASVIRILQLMARYDQRHLKWTESLCFFATAEGAFTEGVVDLVPIEDEDLDTLEDCFIKAGGIEGVDGDILFCARKIGMRPRRAFYEKYIDKNLWPLFDEAGPDLERRALLEITQ